MFSLNTFHNNETSHKMYSLFLFNTTFSWRFQDGLKPFPNGKKAKITKEQNKHTYSIQVTTIIYYNPSCTLLSSDGELNLIYKPILFLNFHMGTIK